MGCLRRGPNAADVGKCLEVASERRVRGGYLRAIMASGSVIPPMPGYPAFLRELTTKHGVVLIFDKVETGFLVALGGAQDLYGNDGMGDEGCPWSKSRWPI